MKQSASMYDTRYTIPYTRDTPRVAFPHPRRFIRTSQTRSRRTPFFPRRVITSVTKGADFRIFRRRLCRIFETDISFVSGRECDRGWGHLARARRVRIASAPSSRPRPRDCGRDTGESPRRANPRHLGGRGASSASAHFRLLARIRRGQPAVPALSSRGVGAGRGASAFRNARGTLRWPPPTWTR